MWLYVILFIIIFFPITLFYPTFVIGRKNLKSVKKKGVIFAVNHQSGMDILLLWIKIFRHHHFVAKKEITKCKPIGWGLRKIGSFAIDRQNPGIEFYKKSVNILNSGGALTLFPEGTRKKVTDDEKLQLKNGAALFAIKTKSPICPMIFLRRPGFLRFNKLVIGEPFHIPFENSSKENLALATQLITQKMEELRAKHTKTKEKS